MTAGGKEEPPEPVKGGHAVGEKTTKVDKGIQEEKTSGEKEELKETVEECQKEKGKRGDRDPGMVKMLKECADRRKLADTAIDYPDTMEPCHKVLLYSLLGDKAEELMKGIHKRAQEKRRQADGDTADIQEHLGVGKREAGCIAAAGDTSCYQCGHSVADLPQGTFHVTHTVDGIRAAIPMKNLDDHTDCKMEEGCDFCTEWDDVIGEARYKHTSFLCPFEPARFKELAREIYRIDKPAERPKRDQSPERSQRRDRSRSRGRSRDRSRDRAPRSSSKRDDIRSTMSEESPNKKGSFSRR